MERLEDLDEAWVMCFRRPRPGWRLFGRFAARDHFVVLGAHDRNKLKNRAIYAEAAQDAAEEWRRLFGAAQPHIGNQPEDYLSGLVRDVSKYSKQE
jgi:hypothetical protein